MKKQISGVYLVRNTVTNDKYIGSSVDILRRWKQHITSLQKSKHYNWNFQALFDVYGLDNLEFLILEECEEIHLLSREQYYIDRINPSINISKEIFPFHLVKKGRTYSNIVLVSPDGNIYQEITNLTKFCREHNLIEPAMYRLLNHTAFITQHKGWYLIEDYKEPDILNYYPEIDDKISIIGKIC